MPGPEWIWVILVIVVLFGASRLPIMGRNVGLGIKEFKKGLAEGHQRRRQASDPGRQANRQRRAPPGYHRLAAADAIAHDGSIRQAHAQSENRP